MLIIKCNYDIWGIRLVGRNIMKLVTDFFLISPFTYYLLFVCSSCKGINDWKRDGGNFKLSSYSTGLQPFCGVEWPSQARKIVVSSIKRCQGVIRRVSFWCLEAYLFRHAWIALSIRYCLGDCYFCIYLILWLYYFILLFVFFYFLFIPLK